MNTIQRLPFHLTVMNYLPQLERLLLHMNSPLLQKLLIHTLPNQTDDYHVESMVWHFSEGSAILLGLLKQTEIPRDHIPEIIIRLKKIEMDFYIRYESPIKKLLDVASYDAKAAMSLNFGNLFDHLAYKHCHPIESKSLPFHLTCVNFLYQLEKKFLELPSTELTQLEPIIWRLNEGYSVLLDIINYTEIPMDHIPTLTQGLQNFKIGFFIRYADPIKKLLEESKYDAKLVMTKNFENCINDLCDRYNNPKN